MSLCDYIPMPLEEVKVLPPYEQLKELVSRGLYWRDPETREVKSIDDIFEHKDFGPNIFKDLFCTQFSEELYPVFAFSKSFTDDLRLLRHCGRAAMIHQLRTCYRAQDLGGSISSQKILLGHDNIENFWKYFVGVSILKEISNTANLEKLAAADFNFINYDILNVDLCFLEKKGDALPVKLQQEYGLKEAFGIGELTDINSIEEKLENGLNSNGQKDISYLTELVEKAHMIITGDITNSGLITLYKDIIFARNIDRIDNTVTMMYLRPRRQLGYLDKTIEHLGGNLFETDISHATKEGVIKGIILEAKIPLLDPVFTSTVKLLSVSDDEIVRNLDYHRKEPLDGYRLEYQTENFAREFDIRLKKIRHLRSILDEYAAELRRDVPKKTAVR